MDTGNRLLALLKERNISLLQFSQISNIPYSTLKSGTKPGKHFSLDTIVSICTGLEITLSEFFSDCSCIAEG